MQKVAICLLVAIIWSLSLINTNDTVDKNNIESVQVYGEKVVEGKEITSWNRYIEEVSTKVKDYINNGQEDKIEAAKLKWSKTFLDRLDIESLYRGYISEGVDPSNVEMFAEYITKNAPIYDDWQELFKKDLKDSYDVEVTRMEYLEGDLYRVYVNIEGREVPFVVVSSRTGYFHA